MTKLDNIIEEAWKHREIPDKMRKAFQDSFETYKENPVYLFEYANALDFLGKESEAIPLYQNALAKGISGKLMRQAKIQLGSSLSVIGENEKAISILEEVMKDTGDPAALVFLCIALFRSGEAIKSLRKSLEFILSENRGLLPDYKMTLEHYLSEIS